MGVNVANNQGQMRRALAAERIRRERARVAADAERMAEFQRGYGVGKRAGAEYRVKLPPAFVDAVLEEMRYQFARRALDHAKDLSVAFPIVARVADVVWSHMKFSMGGPDGLAEMLVGEAVDSGDILIETRVPELRLALTRPRQDLEMFARLRA